MTTYIEPQSRNGLLGGIADALSSVKSHAGLLGDVLLGGAPEMLDRASYGQSPVTFGGTGNGLMGAINGMRVDPGIVDAASAASLLGPAARFGSWAGKEGLRAVDDAMLGGNGLLSSVLSPAKPLNMIAERGSPLGTIIPTKRNYSDEFSSPQFGIDESGQAYVNLPEVFRRDPSYLPSRAFRLVDDFLWGLGDNTYFRAHPTPEDFQYLASGTHRGSINHATGETEGGLSVARNPGLVGYDSASLVSGKRIGTGSDGEPLLDIPSVNVLSPNMPMSQAIGMYRDARQQRASSLGISDDELRGLLAGLLRYF